MSSTTERSDIIRRLAADAGFERVGLAPLQPSDHHTLYRAWIQRGLHGTMGYLARQDAIDARLDPRTRWPELRSAMVVAHHYAGTDDDEATGPDRGIIARYARGRDYHKVMKKKLLEILHRLEEETGEELSVARAYVDTGPILERELAQRAGLGWQGRNTMLIDPRRGSWFFLGSLLLPFELEYDDPFTADRCGSCHACLDACPTGALLGRDENGAPVMDATRCISYLTIENRGAIPEELRPLMGNRIYGCDICQEVCPFTRKFSAPAAEPAYAARSPGEPPFGVQPAPGSSSSHPGTESPSLIALLETALDESAWDSFSRGSAIRRAGRAGFARNVCVALGNWGSVDAVPVLTSALSDPEPLVRAHAAWALGRIPSSSAASALELQAASESDPSVSQEVAAALGS